MRAQVNKIFYICFFVYCTLAFTQITHAQNTEIDGVNYSYTIENDSVEITSVNPASNYHVVVPDAIDGYPVKKVGGFGLTDIKSVVLPDTVTTLGEYAFNWCDKMTEVRLSQNLKSISECAFTNCKKLKTINIPASITRIEDYAFNYCENLESISISDNITYIGKGAFYACKTIKELNFPNELTYIGENAFFNCTSLQTVLIPKSVRSIGKKAFAESVRDDMGTATNFLRYRTYANINYTGTQEEWNKISIADYNHNLINSKINFSVPTCFVKINKTETCTEVIVMPENVENSQIIVSAYKNNIFAYAELGFNLENSRTFFISDKIDYDSIKVFIFEGISTLKPICPSVIRNFNIK